MKMKEENKRSAEEIIKIIEENPALAAMVQSMIKGIISATKQ